MPGEQSGFDAQLHTMADAERRAQAIEARRRRSDRRAAAELSGTFLGTLIELVETNSVVTVLTRTGSHFRGQLRTVGPEIIVLNVGADIQVVIRQSAIEALREFGSGHDRTVEILPTGPQLADVLDSYATDRQRLSATLSSGNNLAGRVSRVGIDQLVLILDGDGEMATIPLAAIDQVVVSR